MDNTWRNRRRARRFARRHGASFVYPSPERMFVAYVQVPDTLWGNLAGKTTEHQRMAFAVDLNDERWAIVDSASLLSQAWRGHKPVLKLVKHVEGSASRYEIPSEERGA